MNKFLVLFIILISAVGCAPQAEPTALPQPIIEQSTTGVTQYDYKAGTPNDYSNRNNQPIPPSAPNPYLSSKYITPIPTPVYNTTYHTTWIGGGGLYYYPYYNNIPTAITIWQGTIKVN